MAAQTFTIKAVVFPKGATYVNCPYCDGRQPLPKPMKDSAKCIHCGKFFILAEYKLGLWYSFLRRVAKFLKRFV